MNRRTNARSALSRRRLESAEPEESHAQAVTQERNPEDFWQPKNRFHALPRYRTGWSRGSRKREPLQADAGESQSRNKHCRRNSEHKPKISFLSLPGEIRNQVYSIVVPEVRVLIIRKRPQKDSSEMKAHQSKRLAQLQKPRLRLSHHLDKWQEKRRLEITMNFLLVCRKVRADVELFLYSRAFFCFDSPKVADKFLDCASPAGIKSITQLEIFDQGYGNPILTENNIWQQRYYQQWNGTCKRIGTEMTGLKRLKLSAYLQKWPYDYTHGQPDAEWKKSFLQLTPHRLPVVEIQLYHHMLQQNPWFLQQMSRNLEDEMMTTEGRQERDKKEAEEVMKQLARKKASRQKKHDNADATVSPLAARRALTIALKDLEVQNIMPVNKVRQKGLEGFASLEIDKMSPAELYDFETRYKTTLRQDRLDGQLPKLNETAVARKSISILFEPQNL